MTTSSSSDTTTTAAATASSSYLEDLGLEWEDEGVDYGETRSWSTSDCSSSSSRSDTFFPMVRVDLEEEAKRDYYWECGKKEVCPCTSSGRYQKNREPRSPSSLWSSKVLRQLRLHRINVKLLFFFVFGIALLQEFFLSTLGNLRIPTLQLQLHPHAQHPSPRPQQQQLQQVDRLEGQEPQHPINERHRGLAAVSTLSSNNTTTDAVPLRRSFPLISERNSQLFGGVSPVNVLHKEGSDTKDTQQQQQQYQQHQHRQHLELQEHQEQQEQQKDVQDGTSNNKRLALLEKAPADLNKTCSLALNHQGRLSVPCASICLRAAAHCCFPFSRTARLLASSNRSTITLGATDGSSSNDNDNDNENKNNNNCTHEQRPSICAGYEEPCSSYFFGRVVSS